MTDINDMWESCMPSLDSSLNGKVIIVSTPISSIDPISFNIMSGEFSPSKYISSRYSKATIQGKYEKFLIEYDVKDEVSESKRIFSELDPYGEENWD